ncbi:hypothetical protein [Bacillus solimangrovi]|uniref:Uncharacterized protein n=1 Tax=Bacillus solimangrovi TaxID=1305675 RepID=A0A1E5LIL0_9BACI|nr:hypothetical protein [Bacillus solimangrovi]OEH93886.1 hypothetical protein BFG57_10460 [Bacillus solimangrovi]
MIKIINILILFASISIYLTGCYQQNQKSQLLDEVHTPIDHVLTLTPIPFNKGDAEILNNLFIDWFVGAVNYEYKSENSKNKDEDVILFSYHIYEFGEEITQSNVLGEYMVNDLTSTGKFVYSLLNTCTSENACFELVVSSKSSSGESLSWGPISDFKLSTPLSNVHSKFLNNEVHLERGEQAIVGAYVSRTSSEGSYTSRLTEDEMKKYDRAFVIKVMLTDEPI